MKKIERLLIVFALLALGVWLLYPTFKWNFMVSNEDKAIASSSNTKIAEYASIQARKDATDEAEIRKKESEYRHKYKKLKDLSSKSIKLGLDLSGGLSVLLESDLESTEKRRGKLSLQDIEQGMKDDVEQIRRRIDEYGVSEIDVHSQNNDQIVIEGKEDIETINTFINASQSLNFAIVDLDKSSRLYTPENKDTYFDETGLLKTDVFSEGFTIHGLYDQDDLGMDVLRGYYVIDESQMLDVSKSNYIQNVETSRDPNTGRPTANFRLSNEGGDEFYKITSKNVGNTLAVLLNGKIKSIATINEALSTNVQVTTGSIEDAEKLVVVLKSSSLPIDLKIISSQSVGSSRGEDAISQLYSSIAIGFGILAIFMLIYYGLSGFLSILMLIFNMFLLLATLASLGLTLTLTSIAGIILTIGMAADSSIIIFERIKEELSKGSIPFNAVQTGYKKARLTILDANITTMIAAIVLSTFGSTAVKGFANTLAVGIVCTLITMLFSSHIIMDLFIREKTKFISVGFYRRRK